MVKTKNVDGLYQQQQDSLSISLHSIEQQTQHAKEELRAGMDFFEQLRQLAYQSHQDKITKIKSDRQQLETRKQRVDSLQCRWRLLCQDIAQQKNTSPILNHSPDPVYDRLNQVHQFRDQRKAIIHQLKYEIEGKPDEFSIKMSTDTEWRTLEEQLRQHFLQQRKLSSGRAVYSPLHVALFENRYTPGTLLERYREIRNRMYFLVDKQRSNFSTRAMNEEEYEHILSASPEELYARFTKEAAKITLAEWTKEVSPVKKEGMPRNLFNLPI